MLRYEHHAIDRLSALGRQVDQAGDPARVNQTPGKPSAFGAALQRKFRARPACLFALVVVSPLACLITPGELAAAPLSQSILILDESAGAAAGPFYAGIVSAVRSTVNRDPSRQFSIFVEHLDLSRFRGPGYEKSLREHFKTKYAEKPIGLIVTVGDGALQYLLRANLWADVPVVFTMVDTVAAREVEPRPNVTGVTYRLKLSKMAEAARAVVPNLAGIAVVGDRLETLVAYRHFKDELPVIAATGLRVIDLTGLPLRELRTRVANLPPQTAIIYTVIYSDGEGRYLAPVEALTRFADAANGPIIVTVDTQIGWGGTGGFVLAPSMLGQAAGSVALRIFDGESASAIPISESDAVQPIFDWRELQRWNVGQSQLPPGTQLRFYEASVWERYRLPIAAVIAAIVLQAVLINWLLYERRQRRHADALARNTMAELAQMDRMAMGSELSASIAHEVMQPLTGVVAKADAGLRWLSAATPDIDKVRAMLTEIASAGHRAAEVVRAVRAVFTKDTQNKEAVQLNDVILEVLDLVKRDLRKRGIAIDLRLAEALPVVTGNYVQLQQVLMNLITNAADSMNASATWPRVIGVRSEAQDAGVSVSVEDNGPGVDPKMLEQIFKPLFTTKAQGMGLGLAICRSIVEAHEGRIWASLGDPQGLTVRFQLPMAGREV